MTEWKPQNDGITHINVYSKGKTDVGRWASNFQLAPFSHPKYGRFSSVEALWYWLSVPETEPARDILRFSHGTEAKKLGRRLRGQDWVRTPNFEADIKAGIRAKYEAHPAELEALRATALPLAHYYVMYGKIFYVPDADWILAELDAIRSGR